MILNIFIILKTIITHKLVIFSQFYYIFMDVKNAQPENFLVTTKKYVKNK